MYHVGEPQPMLLDTLISDLCSAGGVSCRLIRIPPFVVSGAGAVGSALHRVGWSGFALTADKARELVARHWTARTADSLRALGIDGCTGFRDGAARGWAWYRDQGWLG
jgi:hypothetical protein